MTSTPIVRDYYVLATVGVDDDDELSKGHWLDQHLSDQRDDEEAGVSVLRDRDLEPVMVWARGSFDRRPEYYVMVVERRTKKGHEAHEQRNVLYVSPNWSARFVAPNRPPESLEKLLEYCRRAMSQVIETDRRTAMLEKRKREREREK